MKRRLPLIVGIVIILSGFGYLVYGGIGKNLVYFLTPTELLAKGPSAIDAPVRLGGMVKPGTVKWDPNALDLRFELTDGQNQILVHSTGAPPTMFRDTMGVVVEGKLTKSGIFESTNLMVKHSNQYRPPAPGHKPEEMYKTLIREGQN
ncbi:MAG: cytochrome c maturation protein CcmE [Gemmatimonadota bacterium]